MLKFFTKLRESIRSDKADLVQSIIIIAGFAVAAIIAIGSITLSAKEKGEWTANCINNGTAFMNGDELSREDCSRGGDGDVSKEECESRGIPWEYDEFTGECVELYIG